jgi:hypothetical protein
MGESKKFNIARGGSKEKKNYIGKKQNSPTLQKISTYLPYIVGFVSMSILKISNFYNFYYHTI